MRILGTSMVAALLLSLPACSSDGHFDLFGYTSAPNYDTTIRTVYVQCLNTTMLHGSIEFDVARAVINEIQLRTPYRVVHTRGHADTELICKLVKHNKSVINQNQLGENREASLTLSFEVVWRDLRPGKEGDILSAPKRRPDAPAAAAGPRRQGKGAGRAADADRQLHT